MLEAGAKAPDFTLPDQDGNEVGLAGLRGETIVLYFFPRADTPGCTTQACGVRDRGDEYESAGARVIGVSPDTVEAEKKFADIDSDGQIARVLPKVSPKKHDDLVLKALGELAAA